MIEGGILMNEIFIKGKYIDKYNPIEISTIKIYEEDIYDSDLNYFWKSISLSAVGIKQDVSKKVEDIKENIKQETKEEDLDWKKLEEKIDLIETKEETKFEVSQDQILSKFKELSENIDKEIIRLTNLYRIEVNNSKKTAIMNNIKKLKEYKNTKNPSLLLDYILDQADVIEKDSIKQELLKKLNIQPNIQEAPTKESYIDESYLEIFKTLDKMPRASLILYLIKNDPELFRKYSLKQIDEEQAIKRAKYFYLKQKGVPEKIIGAYLNDNYK